MKNKRYKTKKINITLMILITFLLLISIAFAQQITSATYRISRESIDSGGGNFSSSNYFLELSSEPIGGNSSSSNYAICIGLNCCMADVIAKFVNSTLDEATNSTSISFSLWHPDLCMGTTNVTIQCASNCDPCTQTCTISETRHTLPLTDVIFGTNSFSTTSTNSSNIIYCKVTDDTFQLQTCFNSPTNLTVIAEAGGPYSSTTATVLVLGNVTDSTGATISPANVTVDIFRIGNLGNKLATVNTKTNVNGAYFATFSNFALGSYMANVTARYQSLVANVTDVFDVITVYGNCEIKVISLTGKALDATTGLKIPSGTASLTVQETGDKTDTPIVDGSWGTDLTTCVLSSNTYTVTVKLTDNQGQVSWSELKFVAP